MRGPRCKRHQQPAGWRCKGCRALLCPDCVAVKRVHTHTELEVCLECHELAEPLTVHRRQQQGYPQAVLKALVFPLSVSGLFTMVGVGLVRGLLSYAPLLGWVLSLGVLAAVCFSVIRSTSRGDDDFAVTDFSDLWGDVVVPGVKALVAAALVWVPMAGWVWFRWDTLTSPMQLLADPVMWLMLAFGVFYAPMAVLVGAAGNSLFSMLNPLFVVRHALRLGVDYAIAVVTLCILAVPWALIAALGTFIDSSLPLPLLPRIIDFSLSSYVPFVTARVLGLLLFLHGDELGYGVAADYFVPVLAGATPRGVLPEAQPVVAEAAAPRADRYAPIELAEEAAPEPMSLVQGNQPVRRRVTELDPACLPPLPKREPDEP